MQAIATGVVSLTSDTRNFGSTFRGFREALCHSLRALLGPEISATLV